MTRTKIDYGIDLGTTNSAIARMENGEPIIKKSEGFQKDTTPSCVHYNKKKTIFVGDRAYSKLSKEAIESFKWMSKKEGIIPALETSHAISYLKRRDFSYERLKS